MSTSIQPLAPPPSAEAMVVQTRTSVEAALLKQCEALAEASQLSRFEIAVKSRIEAGIKDDNDQRLVDALLGEVVRAGDSLENGTKEVINAAYKLHRGLIAVVKPWKDRWLGLQIQLDRAILDYKKLKAAQAQRQQQQLNEAAEAERQRKAEEARKAMRDGDIEKAKQAMAEAGMVVTPVIMSAAPKLDNTGDRKVWEVKITDPEAFVKSIAAGTVPLSAIKEWDLTFLKKEAAKRGGLPKEWAGVSAEQVDALTHRR